MAAAPPTAVGVCGAGTMGRGIAQAAALGGMATVLWDPVEGVTAKALEEIATALAKGAERGRWSREEAGAARERLKAAAGLSDLAGCDVVIEAAPEDLALKHELFGRVADVVAPDCVLATNTSSLLVTAVAAPVPRPERVVGLHFFNPAPLMRLVEVVAGEDSAPWALDRAEAAGEAMGKRAVRAADVAGFVVNRCNRPFGLEALRAAGERRASFEQIDRICRLAGFRMGPFELMDLVGVDVGLEVSRSFFEQSFGEPRWRPSPIAARMVAAGRHGRKSGRGYHDYRDGAHRPDDPPAPEAGGGEGLVVIAGDSVLADELRSLAAGAGWEVGTPAGAAGEVPFLILDCGPGEDDTPLQGGPQAICCAEGSLALLDPGGGAVGFYALPPLEAAGAVELTRGSDTSGSAVAAAERFFSSLGKRVEWVGDGPGLVLGPIVCQLVNEAAFALGEGVAEAEDIDAGMVLGLNHPRGPLAWGDEIGLDHVHTVLEALRSESGDPAYRAAPALRRRVYEGRVGIQAGEGFHRHDQTRRTD